MSELASAGTTTQRLGPGSGLTALILRQIQGIDAWNAACAEHERQAGAAGLSRSERLDLSRRADVITLARETILARTEHALAGAAHPMPTTRRARIVLAHRHPWTLQRVAIELEGLGAEVVICTDNGAAALGSIVCEQPDVLFAGEHLLMLSGGELLAETQRFAPSTLRVRQEGEGRALREGGVGDEGLLILPAGQRAGEIAQVILAASEERRGLDAGSLDTGHLDAGSLDTGHLDAATRARWAR